MNEPKTPNLGLNKIDRSSPSTTYFDLDKYLDQNWDKVDAFAERVGEKAEETAAQVSNIQERLDTEKRRSVTLEPGVQIVNAERASAFKLEGLKGRTLVNLLGRIGGMESLTGLSRSYTTLALDSINKTSGVNGLKITNLEGASTASAGLAYTSVTGLRSGCYYVLIADAKNIDAESGLQIGFGGSFGGPYSSAVKSRDKFVTIWAKKQISTVTAGNVDLAVVGSVGKSGFFDSVRLYEISAAEYDSLDNMNPVQLATKYPYVDSVQPVRNPYAIRYGENLLPPFYEWTRGSTFMLSNGYAGVLKNTVNDAIFTSIPFKTEVEYTYSAEHTGAIAINAWDSGGNLVGGKSLVPYTTNQSVTFKIPIGTAKLEAYFSNIISDTQTLPEVSIKKPVITIGTTAKPFKPREDAMLALQTDLYADPVTGTNADELFEKDGQYFELKKWSRITNFPSLSGWTLLASGTGWKSVASGANSIPLASINGPVGVSFVTKSDGKVLNQYTTPVSADMGWVASDNSVRIAISRADSGWGDSYTPTADEIKAYFMGWIMYLSGTGGSGKSGITPYNGSGTKYWARVGADGHTLADGTVVLPTTQASNFMPYQLDYQLAMPTVEPIISKGRLTLTEGSNQVEIGTGLVMHEEVKPANDGVGHYNINNADILAPQNVLKYKVRKILYVFKDSNLDKWNLYNDVSVTVAGALAQKDIGIFDLSAIYTVTYMMLDKSPIAPFVGSIAENEKALLNDLVRLGSELISSSNGSGIDKAETAAWQKTKITADSGTVKISISDRSVDILATLMQQGPGVHTFYCIGGAVNALPLSIRGHTVFTNEGKYGYVFAVDYQNNVYTNYRDGDINGWLGWKRVLNQTDYDLLFQLVSDGKSAIAAAITGKGVAASGSDTHAQLGTKVGQIQTGPKSAKGSGVVSGGILTITDLGFSPRNIIVQRNGFSTNTAIYSYDINVNKFAQNGISDSNNAFTLNSGGFSVNMGTGMNNVTFNYIAFSS
ncbi:hypothetical protein [Paenibacillus illinoisensis]|uniref:hypothetical protein n=1 Tax=Paenibacillus illinoisensis TaxID=59845 RepID=UPI000FDB3669|nr:hypothetical protein [Paenibacillus illinoisensis]